MKSNKNIFTGSFLSVIAAFYLFNIRSIKVFAGTGATVINSRTIPVIWGCILLIIGILILLDGIKEVKTYKTNAAADQTVSDVSGGIHGFIEKNFEVIATFFLLFLYVLLIKPLGFIISSALYIFLQTIVLAYGKRKKVMLWSGIISILISVSVYLLFVYSLGVRLPSGILSWF